MTDESALFSGVGKYNSDWNVPITDFPTLLQFDCIVDNCWHHSCNGCFPAEKLYTFLKANSVEINYRKTKTKRYFCPSNSCYEFLFSTQKEAFMNIYSINVEILQSICYQSPLKNKFFRYCKVCSDIHLVRSGQCCPDFQISAIAPLCPMSV